MVHRSHLGIKTLVCAAMLLALPAAADARGGGGGHGGGGGSWHRGGFHGGGEASKARAASTVEAMVAMVMPASAFMGSAIPIGAIRTGTAGIIRTTAIPMIILMATIPPP